MDKQQTQVGMIERDFLDLLRGKNIERAAESFPNLSLWGPGEWLSSLIGEYGEATNVAKKLHRIGCGFHNFKTSAEISLGIAEKEADYVRELADIFIYLDLYAISRDMQIPLPGKQHMDWAQSRMDSGTELAYWQYGTPDICGLVIGHSVGVDEDHMARLVAFLIVAANRRGYDLTSCIKMKFDETSQKIGSKVSFYERPQD